MLFPFSWGRSPQAVFGYSAWSRCTHRKASYGKNSGASATAPCLKDGAPVRSGGDQEHTAFPEGCPTAASGSFGGRILKISQLLMLTQLHFFFSPQLRWTEKTSQLAHAPSFNQCGTKKTACLRLDGREPWGRMDICICEAESLCLKLSQHC